MDKIELEAHLRKKIKLCIHKYKDMGELKAQDDLADYFDALRLLKIYKKTINYLRGYHE